MNMTKAFLACLVYCNLNVKMAENGDISRGKRGRYHIQRREQVKKEIHRLITTEGLTKNNYVNGYKFLDAHSKDTYIRFLTKIMTYYSDQLQKILLCI